MLYELADKKMEIESTANKVLNEFKVSEKCVTDIEDQQDEILKTLDYLDERLERYTERRPFEDNYNVRNDISEKSINVNQTLDQMNLIIQDVNKQLSGDGENGESQEDPFAKHLGGIINNQYDCIKWMEGAIDDLWAQFEVLDTEMERKLNSKY